MFVLFTVLYKYLIKSSLSKDNIETLFNCGSVISVLGTLKGEMTDPLELVVDNASRACRLIIWEKQVGTIRFFAKIVEWCSEHWH